MSKLKEWFDATDASLDNINECLDAYDDAITANTALIEELLVRLEKQEKVLKLVFPHSWREVNGPEPKAKGAWDVAEEIWAGEEPKTKAQEPTIERATYLYWIS